MSIYNDIVGFITPDRTNLVIRLLDADKRELRKLALRDHDGSDILLGRDHQECGDWSIPEDNISKKHAMIYLKGDLYYIRDLDSRNGTLYKGKKLRKEKCLSAKDEYKIGDYTLVVENGKQDDQKVKLDAPCAWLVLPNKAYPMKSETIRIGSEKSCDIAVGSREEGVSGIHAVITRLTDTTFSITDGNGSSHSTNGTYVNNDIIEANYPLRENDEIRLGHSRFVFKFQLHYESAPIRRFEKYAIIIIMTLLTVVAGYRLAINVLGLKPSQYFNKGVVAENMGYYDQAKKEFKNAQAGTDDKQLLDSIAKHLHYIAQMEQTRRKWEECRNELVNGSENEAFASISGFLSNLEKDAVYWTWLEPPDKKGGSPRHPGEEEKEKAIVTKVLLDAILEAKKVLGNPNDTSNMHEDEQNISSCLQDIEKAKAMSAEYLHIEYIHKLDNLLTDSRSELEKDAKDYRILSNDVLKSLAKIQGKAREWIKVADNPDEPMDKRRKWYAKILKDRNPNILNDLRGILEKLEGENGLQNSERLPVKQYVNALKPALISLVKAMEDANGLEDMAAECEFSKILTFKLIFDTRAEWGHANDLKFALQRYVDQLIKDVKTISDIYKRLDNIDIKKLSDSLGSFGDERMSPVYACDCLNMPYPKKSRVTPHGKYDEVLGIEYFYAYVNGLQNNRPQLRPRLAEMKFDPRIEVCYQNIKEIRNNLDYLQDTFKDISWLNKEKSVAQVKRLEYAKILTKRNELVSCLMQRKDKPGTREFLISRGIALYLSSETNNDTVTLKDELIRQYKAYKAMLDDMIAEQYDHAEKIEDKIRNRPKILQSGLPGDPRIKDLWIEEDDLRTSKP